MAKREKKYAVKEVFLTLQGEGHHTGSVAIFVRFAGCNIWSGKHEDRQKAAEKGVCARWCDTDFVGTDGTLGGKYTAEELTDVIMGLWVKNGDAEQRLHGPPLVVCTGGEPSLQLDDNLVKAMKKVGCQIHVETNGSKALPEGLDWVVLSPKPPMPVVDQPYHEVKVVYDATPGTANPLDWETYATERFVQPTDCQHPTRQQLHLRACLAFIRDNPSWRISLQTHKIMGVP